MPLPTKVVRVDGKPREKQAGNSASSATAATATWMFPHLLPMLKEKFNFEDFRSDLQRSAVEAVVQGKS